MASIFVHHVIGDLTVGKPEVAEFLDTDTVESAIRAIGECAEGAITVWRRSISDEVKTKAERFVGILNSLDVVAFIAKAGGDQVRLMKTPVAEVVQPNQGLLKEVDPGTRLIDSLEMMKQGVRRLLVRKSLTWRGVSQRFSIPYNGNWLKNYSDSAIASNAAGRPTSSSSSSSCLPSDEYKYCCLSREDIIRFLIGCLGALAPLPLSSISSLSAITPHYSYIEASSPAIEAVHRIPQDPSAVAVVETNPDGTHKIVGEISSFKLWKCDYLAAAWAMANLSAGQFVMGAEDNDGSDTLTKFSFSSSLEEAGASPSSARPKKFSSRSIGFFSNPPTPTATWGSRPARRNMYRGRSAPLTCKHWSSLAAVMAQLLSHRATHVWVTESDLEEDDDMLVGVVSYSEILHAVTKPPQLLDLVVFGGWMDPCFE